MRTRGSSRVRTYQRFGVRRDELETVLGEVGVERAGELPRFVGGEQSKSALSTSSKLVALRPEMHGIGAQPVGVARVAPVDRERERRERPVVLALDCETLAAASASSEAPGRSLERAAREQRLERAAARARA